MTVPPALAVSGLTVEIQTAAGVVQPVRDISFALDRGVRLGLVGESGSGKSLTALAAMRLLRPPVRIAAGQIALSDGVDVAQLDEQAMTGVRGRRIAMIYQDPLSALNPVQTVGAQLVEAIRAHEDVRNAIARRRVLDLLADVGLPDPDRCIDQYPHEFSGGMRQRVVIAMALCADPDVVIADEPTTALDVTTQARILELLLSLAGERKLAILLITHDLGVAARFCDRIQVMYAGRLVEEAPIDELYGQPLHPYSEGLLASVCRLDADPASPMPAIAGQPPAPGAVPSGCSFHPRCPVAVDRCRTEVPVVEAVGGARRVECHLARDRAGRLIGGTR